MTCIALVACILSSKKKNVHPYVSYSFCRFSYLLGFQNDLVYAYEKTMQK